MTDYEKELLFKRTKDLIDQITEEKISWNPLDEKQAGAWIYGRQYEAMAVIMALGLNIEYLKWEEKQGD